MDIILLQTQKAHVLLYDLESILFSGSTQKFDT